VDGDYMIEWWWSWLLMTLGITGLWLAGSKDKTGWLISLFAQVLWIIYAIVSEQYGFIVSALAYSFVYLRNFKKWVN
jgi:hypothetical protein